MKREIKFRGKSVDNNECDKCVFNGRPECCNYYCLYFERQDKQDVHFEKVED